MDHTLSNLDRCFEHLPERRHTGSLKWDVHPAPDVLPMWVADMDFLSPPAVIETLKSRADHGVFGYGYPLASQSEAIVDWLAYRHQWEIEPAWIKWTPGLVPAIHAVCRTFAADTKNIIVPTPIYPPFLEAPRFAGCETLAVPFMDRGEEWVPDLEQIRSCAENGADLLMLCNPHNPLGRMYRKEELETLAEICVEHDIVLCSDEVHCDLLLDDREHIVSATLSKEIGQRCITLMGATKTFNIAGLGCAWMVIENQDMKRALSATMKGIVGDVNPLGYAATEAALRHGEPWRKRLLDILRTNRDAVETGIGRTDLPITTKHIEAGYLAWLDVSGVGVDRPCSSLQRAGLWLSDGEPFGDNRFLRLNYGCDSATVQTGLTLLSRWAESST